jgi:hypothetical protein
MAPQAKLGLILAGSSTCAAGGLGGGAAGSVVALADEALTRSIYWARKRARMLPVTARGVCTHEQRSLTQQSVAEGMSGTRSHLRNSIIIIVITITITITKTYP